MSELLLEARGLVKRFRSQSLLRGSHETRALDGVDLQIRVGEVLAVIGESGSGKTTLGKVLLRLTPATAGEIRFGGNDLRALRGKALRLKRREFQMVFQNQRANLHPKMTVRQMLDESLRLHRPKLDAEGRAEHIGGLLERVGLSAKAEQRPESLSGGERRRVGLARILATQPKLIVADEPTSGLDAAIKLQIIDLLRRLKESSMTYMLISHDLGLVRRIADRVVVMLKGRIIEEIPAERLGDPRHHPYTARLMRAAHLSEDHASQGPSVIEVGVGGEQRHGGCVYAADCPVARERGLLTRCRQERPEPVALGPGHWVACFASADPIEEEP
ncbi:MAG: ABC transporter ATP-binding protein [Myxococcales bacterium]|nr:ABC transporter ATP-binding protein [Myxococcales bacterium]